MSANAKFRFLLAPIVLTLLVVVTSTVSWAGELEDAQERVPKNPNDADIRNELGKAYYFSGQHLYAINVYRQAIRIKPDYADAHNNLGVALERTNEVYGAIKHTIIAIELNKRQNNFQDLATAKANLRLYLEKHPLFRLENFANIQIPGPSRPSVENSQLEEERKKLEALRLADEERQRQAEENRQRQAELNRKQQLAKILLDDAQRWVRQNPNLADAHYNLGWVYDEQGQYQEAIASYKEAIRIRPDDAVAHNNLGIAYKKLGRNQEAMTSYKEAIRIKPDYANAHLNLGVIYNKSGKYEEAFTSCQKSLLEVRQPNTRESRFPPIHSQPSTLHRKYQRALISCRIALANSPKGDGKEALRIKPEITIARNNLNEPKQKITDEKLASQGKLLKKERKKLKEERQELEEERNKLENLQKNKEPDQLEQVVKRFDKYFEEERKKLEEERKKLEALRLAEEKRQQQAQAEKKPPSRKEQLPQSGSGSGFFVSKMGHVITNAHVVQNCKKVTIGDNANKQVPAELINTDRSNDLALLKLSTLEMASAESKSLIQKLGIVVVPLASKGLLRSEDVRLGEKVLVAGYPFGEFFSNTIKVTSGIVSATRGAGDDSGQFQLDAAVQPGNSGGPIYDSGGNIVGVVISQLDKLKMAKAIGSLPENVNFGIKASTVRQFLTSSGLPSKKSERTEEKSTEQLAKIAKNQALMVMCLQ
jgi:S1-C subfamily serine protease/Flp pilus assembly protein TadD